MVTEGVDYAWSRPSPTGLYRAGKRFVCRYGGPGTDGKHLHLAEARALTAAGLSIVANAEGTPNGLLGGWGAGALWARSADAHFRACGMPPDRPIYLSVDFDATAAQWPAVAAALRGAATVLGLARVGVYGSYDCMVWARRDNVARWFWQTYAWSGGRWAPGCHIQQYENGVNLAGGTLDLDRAFMADYGQWMVGRTGAAEMTPDEYKVLANTHDRVYDLYTRQVPALAAALQAVAAKVDIDPGELAAIQAAVVDAVPSAVTVALSDEQLAAIAAAVVARTDTPLDTDDQPAIEAALRAVLRSV